MEDSERRHAGPGHVWSRVGKQEVSDPCCEERHKEEMLDFELVGLMGGVFKEMQLRTAEAERTEPVK